MGTAFDSTPSARSIDKNGFMHVASSHITKCVVNPYYGREIPGWREAGLDPDKIYYGLRDRYELQKSLPTWNGLPLHIEHHLDSAEEPQKFTRVGAVGKAIWNGPYIDAPLTIWDAEAIEAIKDGSFKELSCAYWYEPDFTPGTYEGVDYDFIMRNIRGNHVALVEEGRAGADVVVADAALDADKNKDDKDGWITTSKGKKIHFKDGQIDKGNIGQEKFVNTEFKPIQSLIPDNNQYQDLIKKYDGNFFKATQEYFKKNLQHSYIPAMSPEGEIKAHITGTSWREIRKAIRTDPLKAELVIHIPDIIATGEYVRDDLYKTRTDGTAYYFVYSKQVQTSKGLKNSYVKVAVRNEKDPRYLVYINNHEDDKYYRDYTKKETSPNQRNYTGEDASSLGNNIISQYEIVNIGFIDEINNNKQNKNASNSTDNPGQGQTGQDTEFAEKNASTKDGDMWALTTIPNLVKSEIIPQYEIVNIRLANEAPQFAENHSDKDIAKDNKTKNNGGGFMDKFKKWFKGAKDENQDIEREEVDLAQAIIDLHKTDPQTGEIVDITEDEDKAAEVRKIVESISGKIDADTMKKLTDALAGLTGAETASDEDEAKDEDADGQGKAEDNDSEASKDEDMKKAMDSCGLDSENPQESKAFAEGVKYGESLEKTEPEKLDKEHESEGMEKEMGKDDNATETEIATMLEGVNGLSDDQRVQLLASIQDILAAKLAGDEDKPAQDSAIGKPKKKTKLFTAMDAALLKRAAVNEAKEHFRQLNGAVQKVRPLCGELDALAFDSAYDVYGYALESNGIKARKYSKQAWRGMVDILLEKKSVIDNPRLAQDSTPKKFDGHFQGLKNITISD